MTSKSDPKSFYIVGSLGPCAIGLQSGTPSTNETYIEY